MPLVIIMTLDMDFLTGISHILCKEMLDLAKVEIFRGLKSSSAAFEMSAQLIQVMLLVPLNLQAVLSRYLVQFLALELGSRDV